MICNFVCDFILLRGRGKGTGDMVFRTYVGTLKGWKDGRREGRKEGRKEERKESSFKPQCKQVRAEYI
jgi:hypothetical protein